MKMTIRSQRGQGIGLYAIIVGVVALLIVGFVSCAAGTTNVDIGYVGVKTSYGHVTGILKPGFYTKSPTENINPLYTQWQHQEYGDIQAATHEQQRIHMDIVVNYQVDERNAAHVITVVDSTGQHYREKVIDPAIQDLVKEVTPKYYASCAVGATDCKQIQDSRPEIRDTLTKLLNERAKPAGIDILTVFLKNYHFDPQYEQAIQQRAAALQAQQQATIEAQTKVTQAKGDADAANARRLSLTPEILQQQDLQNKHDAIQKWDGKLPTYEGGSAIISLTK